MLSDDDDDGNKRISKRKWFADETTDDVVHLQLEGKVTFRVEILNIILEYIFVLLKVVFAYEHDYSTKSGLNNNSNVYSNQIDGKLCLE